MGDVISNYDMEGETITSSMGDRSIHHDFYTEWPIPPNFPFPFPRVHNALQNWTKSQGASRFTYILSLLFCNTITFYPYLSLPVYVASRIETLYSLHSCGTSSDINVQDYCYGKSTNPKVIHMDFQSPSTSSFGKRYSLTNVPEKC